MYMSRLKALQRAACQLKKCPSRVRKLRKQCMCRGRTPFEGRPFNSKRPFKGSSSGNNVHVEVEGPSKGSLLTQKKNPSKGPQPRHIRCFRNSNPWKAFLSWQAALGRAFNLDTYIASGTWTLEGLLWVDRPPFKGLNGNGKVTKFLQCQLPLWSETYQQPKTPPKQ